MPSLTCALACVPIPLHISALARVSDLVLRHVEECWVLSKLAVYLCNLCSAQLS